MKLRYLYAAASVLILALGGYFVWDNWPRAVPRPPPPAKASGMVQADSMDQLLKDLATRVAEQSGAAEDFQIIPTVYEHPVGTLLEKGRSVPEDDVGCVVDFPLNKLGAPSLFPTVTITGSMATGFGLAAPLQELGALGAKTTADDTLTMSVDSPGLITLSNARVKALLQRPECRAALGERKMLLVRGYLVGKRNFVLESGRTVSIDGEMKVGSFKIAPTGGNRISISDLEERKFLQVVSEVQAAPLNQQPLVITAPQAPAPTTEGRIFIQRDASDESRAAERVLTALQGTYDVEPGVERIASSKMPRTPQVRYFNEADRGRAEAVANQMRQETGIAPAIVRVALPAPAGQLEVWLNRAEERRAPLPQATLAPGAAARMPPAAAPEAQ